MSGAAVFLDRDGTIIREAHYLADPDGVVLVDGAAEALRALRAAGYRLVVVTNQSGIARGLYTEAEYHAVAERLDRILGEAGVHLDGTYYCPHAPGAGTMCDCRKPALGMYRAAEAELGVDLARSWFVGDKVSDVRPALSLGGRGVLVRTGYGREQEASLPAGVQAADDLPAAVRLVLAEDARAASGRVDPQPGRG